MSEKGQRQMRVVSTIAGGCGLSLGCYCVAKLKAYPCELEMRLGVLRVRFYRITQLDLRGPYIAFLQQSLRVIEIVGGLHQRWPQRRPAREQGPAEVFVPHKLLLTLDYRFVSAASLSEEASRDRKGSASIPWTSISP